MNKKDEIMKSLRHEHHKHREDLAGEHPYGDAGQIVAAILFFLIWAGDSFFFAFSTIFAKTIPAYYRLILAVPLFVFSGYLVQSGHKIVFKEIRETPKVIDKGVFSLTRHPIYLSVLLLYLGLVFTTLSLISFVVLICIFFFYNYIAAYEEGILEGRFGREYRDYRSRTSRWLLGP
jgi:protein-S-isoprenylcysteine O-methyltransferase Ste14